MTQFDTCYNFTDNKIRTQHKITDFFLENENMEIAQYFFVFI